MPKNTLIAHVIRLAHADKSLRKDLLRVALSTGALSPQQRRIVAFGSTSVVQQAPIIIQQPPIIVQQEAQAPSPMAMPAPMPFFGFPTTPPPMAPAIAPIPAVGGPTPSFGGMLVTEKTQRGFKSDLLPELDRRVQMGGVVGVVAANMVEEVKSAFLSKNALYNVLIQHQSAFEGDSEYLQSILQLIQVWASGPTNRGA